MAGCAATGYSSGDGGPATNATLNYPYGVTFDAAGNLILTDSVGGGRVREVHFAGYPTLTLSNVSANQVGNYCVIVSNPYGSVTSAVATLTVTIPRTPPQLLANDASFGFRTTQFGFNLRGVSGQSIVVDGSTNLVDWMALFTNISDTSPFDFSDPASTNSPRRFYRARLP